MNRPIFTTDNPLYETKGEKKTRVKIISFSMVYCKLMKYFIAMDRKRKHCFGSYKKLCHKFLKLKHAVRNVILFQITVFSINIKERGTRFFYKQNFFPTQPHCCLTFSWIKFQILFRCCLIHISIIIPRQFLYLLYLRPCLDVALFMSDLCDQLLVSILIFTDMLLLLLIF